MRVLFSKGLVAISKPRCGSTSVRRMLDPFIDRELGDLAINMAGEHPPFHPHITAPYLQQLLQERDERAAQLTYFTTIRHPVRMLESYYKFFQPDELSRYNFAPNWDGQTQMSFENWILQGRVGMHPGWQALAPGWISTQDLSPLSLEAHAAHADGSMAIPHVFLLEEPDKLREWLSERLGQDLKVQHVNQSSDATLPSLGSESLEKIRQIMPTESRLYGI